MNIRLVITAAGIFLIAGTLAAQPLPNTQPLTAEGDLAMQMIAGIDRYLMRELAASGEQRQAFWQSSDVSPDTFVRFVDASRERLRHMLGAVDKRLPVTSLEYLSTTSSTSLVAEGDGYRVHAVRWPVFEGVDGEGLLLEPTGKVRACIVAIPDADWTPEMLSGLSPGVAPEAQFARRLAESGCRVVVPMLIDRTDTWSGNPQLAMTNQPHREFIYRMAFEMGRHIIGYEIQKVQAVVDWFSTDEQHPPIGVIGYGEGGLLALSTAAIDTRVQSTVISGHFGPREDVWQQPIFRNVFGLLREFGDAELALLVGRRQLIIEASRGPLVSGPPPARNGRNVAAPGKLDSLPATAVASEVRRIASYRSRNLTEQVSPPQVISNALPGSEKTLTTFLESLGVNPRLRPDGAAPRVTGKTPDVSARQHRQFDQLVAFTQRLYRESELRRREFWSKADASSPEKWQ